MYAIRSYYGIQEDVDVVAVSILSGAHNHLLPKIVKLLEENGADDILVICGGIIPEDDIPFLKESGVSEVFTPGTATQDVVQYIKDSLKKFEP